MSFLDHLDELRRRLVRSIAFVFVAFFACWFVSDYIYNFLALPVQKALAEAQRRDLPIGGLTGNETIKANSELKEGETGRYVFPETTKIIRSQAQQKDIDEFGLVLAKTFASRSPTRC